MNTATIEAPADTTTASDTTTPPTAPAFTADGTLTLRYSERLLAGIAAVALHCAPAKEIVPVIQTVRVSPRTFIATDRYSVGQWTHNPLADDMQDSYAGEGHVLIPQNAAVWLSKQTSKMLGLDPRFAADALVIDFTPESVTVRYAEGERTILATTRFAKVGGNFPPVARLFPPADFEPYSGTVALKPAYLERFTKGSKLTSEREAAMRMTNGPTANPNKPGPVLIEFGKSSDDEQSFRGLLQPNLLLR